MDMDRFHAAVSRIRAEQFFREKAASAPAVSAVQTISMARAGAAEDQDLLKLAAVYCPEAPLAFYEKLGGTFKVAEPPPPKGVSTKKWDELLSGKEKAAGDVVNFTRPVSAKARGMAQQLLSKAKQLKPAVVQNVDFGNADGIRAGIKRKADTAARAKHNAGVMTRTKIEDEFMRTGKLPKGAHEAFGMPPPGGANAQPSGSPASTFGLGTGTLAAGGALLGGVTSGLRGMTTTDKERAEANRTAGPLGRAAMKHPALAGAATGAAAFPLAMRAKTMPGALASAFAPVAGMAALDSVLKYREQRRKTTA